MVKRLEFARQPIYVIADTHGEFNNMVKKINQYDIKDCIIVICGDVGIGFYSKNFYENTLEYLNNECLYRHINLLMIRGNHDDPYYFNNKVFSYSNVELLEDYTILTVGNDNILCVGGAISIDRLYRLETDSKRVSNTLTKLLYDNPKATEEEAIRKTIPSYWVDEKPTYDEEKLNYINNLSINIDYVLTHTSPSFCFKKDKNDISEWMKYDNFLEKDLNDEREVFTKIYDFLTENNNIIKKWVYGHFHESNNEKINGTDFIALINSDFYFQYTLLNSEDDIETF